VHRYTDILYRQVGALRKRWLVSNFIAGILSGAYWGIASDVTHYDVQAVGYPGEVADGLIARIRTDLDAFSDAEAAVLENHGYALAEAAVQRHLPTVAAAAAPFRVPNPVWDWTHLREIAEALRHSHRRTLLGRW
jgi:NTE family protein